MTSKGSIMCRETLACSGLGRGGRAHIHGTEGDRGAGEDGRHQDSEWTRCGEDLLATLLCKGEKGHVRTKTGSFRGVGLDV